MIFVGLCCKASAHNPQSLFQVVSLFNFCVTPSLNLGQHHHLLYLGSV